MGSAVFNDFRPSVFRPKRCDDLSVWLKKQRDSYRYQTVEWRLLDELLNEYRERADRGISLLEEFPEP